MAEGGEVFKLDHHTHFSKEEYREWFRDHLIQLQCTHYTWMGDKIPFRVAQYILGDLAYVIKHAAFLKDQRVLLDLDLSPEQMDFVQHKLCQFRDHLVTFEGHECRFTFYTVGFYPNLVDLMVNLATKGRDGSILEEDVHPGIPVPESPPELQYLPFTPPSHSTPGKPKSTELSEAQARTHRQVLELMQQLPNLQLQNIVKDLARQQGYQLVVEGSKPVEAIPRMHHLSSIQPDPALQESMAQVSSALVSEMVNKGVLQGRVPRVDIFTGDSNTKISFDQWERKVLSWEGEYTDQAIKEAITNSVKGRPLQDIGVMPAKAHWKDLVERLRTKYQTAASYDVLMGMFYDITMEDGDDLAAFSTKLEQQLRHVVDMFPSTFDSSKYWPLLRERFFHGMPENIKTNTRSQYNDSSVSYEDLLAYARKIETEANRFKKSHDKVQKEKDSSHKKPKVSAVQTSSNEIKKIESFCNQTTAEIQAMQRTVQELTKAVGKLQQVHPSSSVSASVTTATEGDTGQNNTPAQPRGRGGGGGFGRWRGRWRGGRGGNYNSQNRPPPLCYFCRDHLSAAEANHRVYECPLLPEVSKRFWDNRSANTPAGATGSTTDQGN